MLWYQRFVALQSSQEYLQHKWQNVVVRKYWLPATAHGQFITTDQMLFPGFCRFYVLFCFFFSDSWTLVENRQRLLAAGWYSRYLIFISQNHGLTPSVGWLGSRMISMVIGKCFPEHKTLQKHFNCDTRWTRNFPCLSTVSRQFSQILAIFTPRRGNSNVKKAGCSPEISMSFNAGRR